MVRCYEYVGIVDNNWLMCLVFQEVDNIKEEFEANFNDEEIEKIGKNTVPQEKYDELKVHKYKVVLVKKVIKAMRANLMFAPPTYGFVYSTRTRI